MGRGDAGNSGQPLLGPDRTCSSMRCAGGPGEEKSNWDSSGSVDGGLGAAGRLGW